VTILVTNNFLFYKLVYKVVTIVTSNFWSLKLVINEAFSCSDYTYAMTYKDNCANATLKTYNIA